MKKIFLIIVCCIGAVNIHAQTNEDVFTVVEQWPEFPGGEQALNKFFADNLTYPNSAKEQGIQGKVWVSFIVDEQGTLSDIKVVRGIGGGCDEEALRVVKKMPQWNPGKTSGRMVKVIYKLPIKFVLK